MRGELAIKALIKMVLGAAILTGAIFGSAGTLRYWNGWVLMGALFIPMTIMGVVMLCKCPELLRKRLNSREKEGQHRAVVAANGILFISAFVVSGLGWRLGWYMLPDWVVWTAVVLFLGAYAMYAEVLRENSYLSRTIEVQQGQKVVDTGLYGVVRHPMYTSTIVLFLTMPMILGSPIATLIMLLYIPLIVKRITLEERLLERELQGYREYKLKVRYRLIPYIW